MKRHRLDDKTWNKLYACLQTITGIYAGQAEKSRRFLDAVHWIMCTGAPWADLPAELGKGNSVFKRFANWSDKAVWGQLHEQRIDDPDLEWLLLDGTVVRAHPCAAGARLAQGSQAEQALGKRVGGFSTKIHVVVDAHGNPLRLVPTGG